MNRASIQHLMNRRRFTPLNANPRRLNQPLPHLSPHRLPYHPPNPNPPKLRRFTDLLPPPNAFMVLHAFLTLHRVKLVTYFPQNSPGIHASNVLFSSSTGQTLATLDGTVLTLYRTSSISGLASKLLSRPDAAVLVMVGAGALAPHLIRAHLAARPGLKEVIIWNRTRKNAVKLAEKLTDELGQNGDLEFRCCDDELDEVVGLGDIVCCATNSESALVKGEKLKRGAHLDLVGSFREEMKECDDEALRRAAAVVEAGEIVGGLGRGVIVKEEVGLLVDLISGVKGGRKDGDEITVFKSVGSGVVDMLAAQFVYENWGKKKKIARDFDSVNLE